jgi:hypothetical protein
MWRRIVLSLGLLISIVVLLPFAISTAHNLRSQWAARSQRFHHHSRAWWRRHRAKMRRRQALLAKRRALAAEARNRVTSSGSKGIADNHAIPSLALPAGLYKDGAFSMPLPSGWSAESATKGTTSFRIASSGTPTQATLAVVAAAPANANQLIGREQRNNLAGLPFSDLRRTVIDRMVSAGGWVVNDRQREIAGRRVFEVIAQTPANSDKPEQVWNFYFTEVNGRIYSLTTHSNTGLTGKLAADAEKFLESFRPMDANRTAMK